MVQHSSDSRCTVLITLLVWSRDLEGPVFADLCEWQERQPNSSSSGSDFKFVARITSWDKHSALRAMWSLSCSRLVVSALAIADVAIGWQQWRSSSSSRSSNSELGECNNYEVKTLYKGLCSRWAWAFNSPHTCAPLPLHYVCDSGTSCCNVQLGATQTLGELLQHHHGGIAHGATKPQICTLSARGASAGVPQYDCSHQDRSRRARKTFQ